METVNNKIESHELKPSEIELHFFRHSIKEKSTEGEAVVDESIKLSQEGRELAKEKSFKDVNFNQALSFGSPRTRTQETAIYMMTGKEKEITGEETLEELKDKINKDLKIGSKIGVDNNLDFNENLESPLGKLMLEAYMSNRFLKFLVQDSDRLTRETGDNENSNYSSRASQIAKIIMKYVKISPKWQDLVSEEPNGYTGKLERYMGTHNSIMESFLAKIIETKDGLGAREEFVNAYPNGMDYLEGFTVDIVKNAESDPLITIKYKLGEKDVSKEITIDQLKSLII